MRSLVSAFIFLLCAVSLFAQKNGSVSGTIFDELSKQTIISGTVDLVQGKDSTIVAGTITSTEGTFKINNLSQGDYTLRISYLGYSTYTQAVKITDNQPSVNAGDIYLKTDDFLLQAVVVEGKRAEIVVKKDTIEYNADSYKVTENAVVEDLLKKLPGVEVDSDGKITVNGREVKKFKVDGEDFFSDDPQVASKNLPADMIEKLQVVDQRSEMARMTGFDDGDEETIINITVKSGMKKGTMGNVLLGGGADIEKEDDFRYQGGVFVNHMHNKDRYTLIVNKNNNNNMGSSDLGANQFGGRMRRGASGGLTETLNFMLSANKQLSSTASLNGDFRYNGIERNSITKREETSLSTLRSELEKINRRNDYNSDNFSANLRFEWNPDTLNTLFFRPYLRYNNSDEKEQENSTMDNYDTGARINEVESFGYSEANGISFGGTLDYSHKFKNKIGRVLSINVRGNFSDSEEWDNTYWLKNITDTGEIQNNNQRAETDNKNNNIRATLSWVEPLGKNNFLQTIYRYAYYDNKGINSTYDLDKTVPYLDYAWWLRDNHVPLEFLINPSSSRSTVRESSEHRFGLNFKTVHKKYNLTVGFNIDPTSSKNLTYQPSEGSIANQFLHYPYDSRIANLRGDSLISEIKQDVINFSPIINFRYDFGERSDFRLDYEGRTNQPSNSQLRDYIDKTNPNNWVQGNPDLSPSYTNSIRARFNKFVVSSQLMYNIHVNADFTVKDIASLTYKMDDGTRLTTYENVNGNWNINTRFMFNVPLLNKKFTIGSFNMFRIANRKSFITENMNKVENKMENYSLMHRSFFNYRSSLFDVGLNLNINYSDISYTARPEDDLSTFNWGGGLTTAWYLPYKFTIESDITYTHRDGYPAGYNLSETIWNASVTKQLFSMKHGTGSLKLQIYDILKDRNNLNAAYTTNGYSVTEYNTIPSYFMCSFIYKFNIFPKSSSATKDDFEGNGRRRFGEHPPGGRSF
jgi:hypothetical protein